MDFISTFLTLILLVQSCMECIVWLYNKYICIAWFILKFSVTVSGSQPFKGFFIQARRAPDDTTPLGVFEDIPPEWAHAPIHIQLYTLYIISTGVYWIYNLFGISGYDGIFMVCSSCWHFWKHFLNIKKCRSFWGPKSWRNDCRLTINICQVSCVGIFENILWILIWKKVQKLLGPKLGRNDWRLTN